MWYQGEVTGVLEAGLLGMAAGPIRCSRCRRGEGKTRLAVSMCIADVVELPRSVA
ncbi:hypothetical protein HMPREF9582_02098 [Cutibacterium acnes HL060PA1]|nr:hypothetical protein HMPREF9603_00636 [Cutibacterium acnes HL001PA1]EFT10194.1 hypothetical protein HMPREF9619_01399 [Cutibacterium acnes HL082PA2]EFT25960.1 hypothetical protein HMPREF9577_01441 [Cutibacterium acnes HL110PA3]EFT62769.1 hypothetical protein HMPREF9578_02048 [Cutibacterium acnes HL110PA4]EFT66922.1 hypothetical protein HMPREF9582_02098 [Cutibacterium acnes HL060PA1]EFT76242.1 hypothetical protein HMPREF9599_02530 [Cutibacterium acnes HL050PA2]EGE69797.1 hypothetical protein